MTPYQFEQLVIRVNRAPAEGREVFDYVMALRMPSESVAAFLEATAELATLADRERVEPEPQSWLRWAERAAASIGYEQGAARRTVDRHGRRRRRGGFHADPVHDIDAPSGQGDSA